MLHMKTKTEPWLEKVLTHRKMASLTKVLSNTWQECTEHQGAALCRTKPRPKSHSLSQSCSAAISDSNLRGGQGAKASARSLSLSLSPLEGPPEGLSYTVGSIESSTPSPDPPIPRSPNSMLNYPALLKRPRLIGLGRTVLSLSLSPSLAPSAGSALKCVPQSSRRKQQILQLF